MSYRLVETASDWNSAPWISWKRTDLGQYREASLARRHQFTICTLRQKLNKSVQEADYVNFMAITEWKFQ